MLRCAWHCADAATGEQFRRFVRRDKNNNSTVDSSEFPALNPAVQHGYRRDIDGLRGIAILTVVGFHFLPSVVRGGFIGVDIFFVISGYLISAIVLAAAADGRFSLSGFYARRIKRIFPALALVLGSVLTVGWSYLYADDYANLGMHAGAGAAFAANLVQWNESSYFDTAAELKPLLHLWSLGIEEQFYFVWPLLLAWASRRRRGPLAAVVVLGVMSFGWAIVTVRLDRTAAFFAPWTRFWELLAGAALAAIDTALSAASPAVDDSIGSVLGTTTIPGAAGAPSGTPANTTGFPMYWDSTNLQLYVYTGGAWKKSAAFT